MVLAEKDTLAYIKELQFLQREINFLEKSHATKQELSFKNTIELLRNSQDKLYGTLAQHGVTAEQMYKIITENNEKKLVSEVMKLQKEMDRIRKQLSNSELLPIQTQKLEKLHDRKNRSHVAKWDEIINSPNKKELISKVEQAQKQELAKEANVQDKKHELEFTR
jgi:hypothetical protein